MKKIALVLLILIAFPLSAEATRHLEKKPTKTLKGEECKPWARIELWRDDSPYIREEKFVKTTEHLKKSIFGRGIYEAFGTTTPHSKNFLLHYAEGWDQATEPVPVLLVHGAQSDATRSYASSYFDGSKGLMQKLSKKGFAVFAITFPNGQGNLFYQAEHIANAIKIIKKRTKKKKVDIICHSAGGISTRMYLASFQYRWGTRYRGDVRKVIFVGVPHMGIDFIFRHPIAYVRFKEYGMPCPWDWTAQEGDMSDKNLFCGAYNMQLQLLNDLTHIHKLKKGEPDWYTTYHGGKGYVSRCKGLKKAMKMGGNHIPRLRRKRFPSSIDVYLLAGTKQVLKYHDLQGKIQQERGEYHGTSDGIVFLESAMDVKGLRKVGAKIKGTKVLPLNHVELLFKAKSTKWMVEQLTVHSTNL